MNPKFLSNAELIAAFENVKKMQIAGERVTSWSSSGTSISKTAASGVSDAARGNFYAREIQYRIHEGRISREEFPYLPAIPRPAAERISI